VNQPNVRATDDSSSEMLDDTIELRRYGVSVDQKRITLEMPLSLPSASERNEREIVLTKRRRARDR
jgi:hypothetical protein